MLETPEIVNTERQLTAVIHLQIPRSEIQHVMGPGLMELMGAVSAQNIPLTGPWFTHHFKITPESFDFEIGVPVAAPVASSGRMASGVLPATKVARAVYAGPYEGLASAWGEFDGWIKAQGLKAAQDLWEVYLAGPETGPDSRKYRTQFNRPLED